MDVSCKRREAPSRERAVRSLLRLRPMRANAPQAEPPRTAALNDLRRLRKDNVRARFSESLNLTQPKEVLSLRPPSFQATVCCQVTTRTHNFFSEMPRKKTAPRGIQPLEYTGRTCAPPISR